MLTVQSGVMNSQTLVNIDLHKQSEQCFARLSLRENAETRQCTWRNVNLAAKTTKMHGPQPQWHVFNNTMQLNYFCHEGRAFIGNPLAVVSLCRLYVSIGVHFPVVAATIAVYNICGLIVPLTSLPAHCSKLRPRNLSEKEEPTVWTTSHAALVPES